MTTRAASAASVLVTPNRNALVFTWIHGIVPHSCLTGWLHHMGENDQEVTTKVSYPLPRSACAFNLGGGACQHEQKPHQRATDQIKVKRSKYDQRWCRKHYRGRECQRRVWSA